MSSSHGRKTWHGAGSSPDRATGFRYCHWSIVAVLLLAVASARAPGISAGSDCVFTLGFQALKEQIPYIVGDCIENEWHNPENGDGLQRTTGGLLVWRKADNWTAFTDGVTT